MLVSKRATNILLVLILAVGIGIVAMLATGARGGPLDPPGPVSSTMKTLEDIPGSWSKQLSGSGGDACNTARFTCVLTGEAVRDNETGLVWERAPFTELVNWSLAVRRCGNSLVGGRGGWRLPTDTEMRSLLDPNASATPLLPDGHPFNAFGPLGHFWTTSAVPGETDLAYAVDIDTLGRYPAGKTELLKRWCVRGVQADAPEDSSAAEEPPAWYQTLDATGGCFSARFRCVMENGDAVLDRETGLVWQRAPSGSQVWINSFVICAEAQTGGRKGWRLPTREEIATLYSPTAAGTPALPVGHPFTPNIVLNDRTFWTRTEWGGGAISFEFSLGGSSLSDTSGFFRVWCVRSPGASVHD